jgi:hypothetical protein
MDDPNDIADAFAATARKVVNQSRDEAVKAFNDINGTGPDAGYTAGDAIKSMATLAKIAVTGGIEMGQTALEARPTQGVLILADHIATVLSRGVKEAAQVAAEASDLVDKDKYGKDEWVQSAIKLTNIAFLRGSEILQTVAAGPAQYGDPIAKETIKLSKTQVDAKHDRVLKIRTLKLGGAPKNKAVPDYRISFEPTDGVLKKGQQHFTLVVNSAGLPSGVYLGEVELHGGSPADIVVSVAIDL